MGMAKSITGYSVYSDYTVDNEVFIKNLSERLDADFIVNTYDIYVEPLHEKDLVTSFSKPNKYRLDVMFNECKQKGTVFEAPNYLLIIPIDYTDDDSIEIVFYPNKFVEITFLTFDHLWSSFINTLKFSNPWIEDRKQEIAKYEKLRSEYINICKKLGMDSMAIFTDVYYHIENLADEEAILTFSDILTVAKEKDNLTCFDFEEILSAGSVTGLSEDFLMKDEWKILLIDNLNPNNAVANKQMDVK